MDATRAPAGLSQEQFAAQWPPLPANFAIPEGEPENILSGDPRAFRLYAREHFTTNDWRLHRWAYARLTELVDSQIGQVLSALRESGLETNTLVVFVSDHGDMDASHHLEHKSVFYDEAAKVPFIVSWKGVTKAGLVDKEHLVSSGRDMIPTLCDFAGIPIPASLKGRSLRELAEGSKPSSWRETQVAENGESRMVRSARYKYVVYAAGARREMLTDMVDDPGELKNSGVGPEIRYGVGRTPPPASRMVSAKWRTAGRQIHRIGRREIIRPAHCQHENQRPVCFSRPAARIIFHSRWLEESRRAGFHGLDHPERR